MLISFSIGVAFFIVYSAIKQQNASRFVESLYWSVFILLGLFISFELYFNYLFIVFLPPLIRMQTYWWFGKNFSAKNLIGIIPMGLVLGLIIEFTHIDQIVLIGYLLFEIIFSIRKISRVLRLKGIHGNPNPGKKISWTYLYYFLNLGLLVLIIISYSASLIIVNPLIISVYSLIAIWGVIKYAGKTDGFQPLIQGQKYIKSTLHQKDKYRILKAIDHEIKIEKFHLDPNASLTVLAKKVKASTHQVSQVINESHGLSFFELLAYHRIQEGRKLLADIKFQHYKIEEIAERVGYLSKSAFNTSFKKITGLTPSEYKNRDVRERKVERQVHGEISNNIFEDGTFGYIKNATLMFSNFFKIYLRSLLRNKAFGFINIFGLTVGLSCCLLIFVYLNHELSYDKFHENAEDIYRVAWISGNSQTRTPHPLAQALAKDFTQVESAVSLSPIYGPGLTLQSIYIRNPENNIMFSESDGFLVDSTFFDVFDFELIIGNKKEALAGVGFIVITENLAKKYFGDENPLGKNLEAVEYGFTGVITGVMKDPPANSHFHPQFMLSYMTRKSSEPENPWWGWGDFGHFNYIKLKEGTNPREIEDAIPDWLAKYLDLDEDDILEQKTRLAYLGLQPIEDIHLHSNIRWELEANSNITYVYILIAAIFIIIVIASINFINLSTARAYERFKEVGIRKTMGALNSGISFQFITEAIVTSFASLILAYGCAILVFPKFVYLVGKPILLQDIFDIVTISFVVIVTFSIGVISGVYPAMTVTKIKPVEILKGKFVNQSKGSILRKSLVIIQFMVSTIMIFGSGVVLNQIRYMENKELGFEEEQTIVIELHTNSETERIEAIKSELREISGVIQVGGMSNLPGSQFNQNSILVKDDPENRVSCSEIRVDFEALQVLGLKLKNGRWFDKTMSQDSAGASYIVNEAAIRSLNISDVFNTKILWDEESGMREGNIVGVIEDFHYKSLHENIQPVIININFPSVNYLLLKYEGKNAQELIKEVALVHRQFDSAFDLDFFFLDERINNQYQSERKAFGIFYLFTFIAIALAALGLLGLAYLIITQRTREIGIRKVIGAKVWDILWMENKAFLKIIAISLIIGLPISYLLMQSWLDAFAYRAPFSITPFISTIFILLMVGIGSVTFAVLQTVLKNPSVALRYE